MEGPLWVARKKLEAAATQIVSGGGDIEQAAREAGMPVALLKHTDQFRDVEIWPDQAATVDVFRAMITQWRMGPGGPIGLDYSALTPVMRWLGVPPAERAEVFDGVRIMERAALAALRKT